MAMNNTLSAGNRNHNLTVVICFICWLYIVYVTHWNTASFSGPPVTSSLFGIHSSPTLQSTPFVWLYKALYLWLIPTGRPIHNLCVTPMTFKGMCVYLIVLVFISDKTFFLLQLLRGSRDLNAYKTSGPTMHFLFFSWETMWVNRSIRLS